MQEPLRPAVPVAVLLAKGTPPKDGADARVEFRVELAKRGGRVFPDGSIDLRERNAAVGVVSGQVVARVEPAVPGAPGWSLMGEEMLARGGADAPLAPGENARAEAAEGGVCFVARVDGHVSVLGGAVHVRSVSTVAGDVDYGSGNTDVPGDVDIRGTVHSGFRVRAGGTVTVELGATVESPGRRHHRPGRLRRHCEGLRSGRRDDEARPERQRRRPRSIAVGAAVISGRLRAGVAVRVEPGAGPRGGSTVGGHVQAPVGITAARLGSAEADRTVVGVGPDPEDAAQVRVLRQRHTVLVRDAADARARLGVAFVRDPEPLQRLLARTSAAQLGQVEAALKQVREWEREAAQIEAQIAELDARAQEALGRARVRARERIGADVELRFGPQTSRAPEDIVGGCVLCRAADGRVLWRALDAATAP